MEYQGGPEHRKRPPLFRGDISVECRFLCNNPSHLRWAIEAPKREQLILLSNNYVPSTSPVISQLNSSPGRGNFFFFLSLFKLLMRRLRLTELNPPKKTYGRYLRAESEPGFQLRSG